MLRFQSAPCSHETRLAPPSRPVRKSSMPFLDVSRSNPDQKKLMLQYAAEARRFEIERFWQRSLFFWGFIGAAFITYGVLSDDRHSDRVATLCVSVFGFLASVAWLLVNRGSKYWQEAWEAKVEIVETHVLGAPLFSNIEPIESQGLLGAGPYSVSRLTSILSIMSIIIWAIIICRQVNSSPLADKTHVLQTTDDFWAGAIVSGAVFLAIFLFVFGRSSWSTRSGKSA